MSISSYASDHSAASHPHSCEFIQSNPSRQSGMVQPVVNEMFATVHAAGSSLLSRFIHFMYNVRFDIVLRLCDSSERERKEPRCLQTYDTDP
eukprot:scaffold8263_cov104-Isochrysis_galbana.AAC.10